MMQWLRGWYNAHEENPQKALWALDKHLEQPSLRLQTELWEDCIWSICVPCAGQSRHECFAQPPVIENDERQCQQFTIKTTLCMPGSLLGTDLSVCLKNTPTVSRQVRQLQNAILIGPGHYVTLIVIGLSNSQLSRWQKVRTQFVTTFYA